MPTNSEKNKRRTTFVEIICRNKGNDLFVILLTYL